MCTLEGLFAVAYFPMFSLEAISRNRGQNHGSTSFHAIWSKTHFKCFIAPCRTSIIPCTLQQTRTLARWTLIPIYTYIIYVQLRHLIIILGIEFDLKLFTDNFCERCFNFKKVCNKYVWKLILQLENLNVLLVTL